MSRGKTPDALNVEQTASSNPQCTLDEAEMQLRKMIARELASVEARHMGGTGSYEDFSPWSRARFDAMAGAVLKVIRETHILVPLDPEAFDV